jgi:hypothetical protein
MTSLAERANGTAQQMARGTESRTMAVGDFLLRRLQEAGIRHMLKSCAAAIADHLSDARRAPRLCDPGPKRQDRLEKPCPSESATLTLRSP